MRDIGDTSVQLSWSRGFDNHSPIARYLIEARTLLSSQWKQMRTSECPHGGTGGTGDTPRPPAPGPSWLRAAPRSIPSPPVLLDFTDPVNIEGNAETAQVVNLIPWMDYEFRVLASNILGIGEPSLPSSKIRTKEAGGCGDNPRSVSPPAGKGRLDGPKGSVIWRAPGAEATTGFSAFLPISVSKTSRVRAALPSTASSWECSFHVRLLGQKGWENSRRTALSPPNANQILPNKTPLHIPTFELHPSLSPRTPNPCPVPPNNLVRHKPEFQMGFSWLKTEPSPFPGAVPAGDTGVAPCLCPSPSLPPPEPNLCSLLSFGDLTAPTVAPSGLGGGGGAPNELIVTWTVSWEWEREKGGNMWHFFGEKSALPSQFGHGVEPRAGLDGPSTHFLREISAAVPVRMSQKPAWMDQGSLSLPSRRCGITRTGRALGTSCPSGGRAAKAG